MTIVQQVHRDTDWSGPLVPVVIEPQRAEHVGTYIRRLATVNGLKATELSNLLGIRHIRPSSDAPTWQRLAAGLGVDLEHFAEMRVTKVEKDLRRRSSIPAYRVDGLDIGTQLLAKKPRVCPKCLSAHVGGSLLWLISLNTVCLEHSCSLVELCDCGRDLSRWLRCSDDCICGRSYESLSAVSPPPEAIVVAKNLVTLSAASEARSHLLGVAEELQTLSAHDYLALIRTVGAAAVTPAELDPPVQTFGFVSGRFFADESVPDAIARIKAAKPILEGWPTGFEALVTSVKDRNPKPVGNSQLKRAFSTQVGRLLLFPMRGSNDLPLTPVVREARRLTADRFGISRHCSPTVRSKDALRICSAANAHKLRHQYDGLSFKKANQIYAYVMNTLPLVKYDWKDADLAEHVTRRMRELVQKYRTAISGQEAMKILAPADYEQPMPEALSRLLPCDQEVSWLRPGWLWGSTPAAVQGLLDQFAARAAFVRDTEGLIPLWSALKVGVRKPWYDKAMLLSDVLDGLIPSFTNVGEPNLWQVYIDRAQAERISHARRYRGEDQSFVLRQLAKILPGILADRTPSSDQVKRWVQEGKVRIITKKTIVAADRKNEKRLFAYNIADIIKVANSSP